jgi:hypothetical protein
MEAEPNRSHYVQLDAKQAEPAPGVEPATGLEPAPGVREARATRIVTGDGGAGQAP